MCIFSDAYWYCAHAVCFHCFSFNKHVFTEFHGLPCVLTLQYITGVLYGDIFTVFYF